MPAYLLIVAVIAGAALGAALAWAFLRGQSATAAARIAAADKDVAELRAERETAAKRAEELQQANSVLQRGAAELEERVSQLRARGEELLNGLAERDARIEAMRDSEKALASENAALASSLSERETKHQEQLKLLNEAEKALKESFASLAREALSGNNESFLKLAQTELERRREQVDALVKPIGESLGKFQVAVVEIEKRRAEAYGGISEQLKSLREAQQTWGTRADELATALRGKPTRWGSWGELQLKNVVEAAGMNQHCDYDVQVTVRGSDNQTLRLDLVVNLPNGRRIIVDSKAPIELFLSAVEEEDHVARADKLKRYADGLKTYRNDLCSKRYWDALPGSPELVLLFLPGESYFSAALEADGGLLDFNAERPVVLSTPTTLIALLRAVAYGWRQERLAEHAIQVGQEARLLYERLCTFLSHLQGVGTNLDRATKAYNLAVGSLDTRLMVQARKFQELGVVDAESKLPEVPMLEVSARAIGSVELLLEDGNGSAED